MRVRTAALLSGRGSNLKSLIAACAAKDFPAEIVLVISNVEGAGGLTIARDAGIATKTIPHKPFPSREAFDAEIDAALRRGKSRTRLRSGLHAHPLRVVREAVGGTHPQHPSLAAAKIPRRESA